MEMGGIFRLPLIPVLVAYIIGLFVGYFDPPYIDDLKNIIIPILLIFWILFIFKRFIFLSGLVSISIFILLGIISIKYYLHPPYSTSNITNFHNIDPLLIEGVIDKSPVRLIDKTRLVIRSEKVILSNRAIPVKGHVLIYIKEKNEPFRLGDRLRIWCRLTNPRGFKNPGVFDYEKYLAFERIYTIGFLKTDEAWIKIGEGFNNPVLIKIEALREKIRTFLDKESHPQCSGIFKALVLGEQEYVSEELKETFITTGIAHLLAISGDHLGIVALLSFSLILWFLKRSEFILLTINVKKFAALLTLPCIILYTFIAGAGISVIRATLMVCIFLLSIIFRRERNLIYTLALSAFIILIFSPSSIFDVSFQLSFLAVLSILYLVPWIIKELKNENFYRKWWGRKILNYIKISFVVTIVATFGTIPFVLLHFNRISLLGIITNLFAIPWVGFIIVPLSLIASLLSFIFYPISTLIINLNSTITLIFLKVIKTFSSIPYASIFISTPTLFEMIIFYLIFFSIVYIRRNIKIRYVCFVLIILLIIDLAYWDVKGLFKKDLTINFIDVGHGDSILLEFPKGKRMLIDGGGLYEDRFDIGKSVIAPFLWRKKIRHIDILVLTHPDPDHFKGLKFIISQFSIGQYWDNGLKERSDSFYQIEEALETKKIKRISKDEQSPPISIGGAVISFFNPARFYRNLKKDLSPSDINNSSLVIKLQFKNVSALFTGDIEKEAELNLIKKNFPLRSDILKIPHHGSLSSSSKIFIDSVKPSYAILSVSDYGWKKLPHPEVLNRYTEAGSIILRTDKHGAIEIDTDGEKISVKTFTNFPLHHHQIHRLRNHHHNLHLY